MPNLGKWIDHPHSYLMAHYRLVAAAAAVEVVVAMVLAFLAAAALTWRHRGTTVHSQDTIWYLFNKEVPGGLPYVTVKTKGGMTFVGQARTFDTGGARADRHLVIGPPLTEATYGKPPDPPTPWKRVVVPLDEIEHMHVMFDTEAAVAADPPTDAAVPG